MAVSGQFIQTTASEDNLTQLDNIAYCFNCTVNREIAQSNPNTNT